MTETKTNGLSSTSVKAVNGGTIDPSLNTKELIAAALVGLEKQRVSEEKINDAKNAHLKEIGDLRSAHAKERDEMRSDHQAEISKLREGYQEKIQIAANTAITTLAKQTTDLSTTLAKQVSDTATAAETRSSSQYNDTNKRVSALELSSSEGRGAQAISEPQRDKLAEVVERLERNQAAGGGRSEGMEKFYGWIIGGVALLFLLLNYLK